jgi:hypothetical protein
MRWFWSMTINSPMTRSDRHKLLVHPQQALRRPRRHALEQMLIGVSALEPRCSLTLLPTHLSRSLKSEGFHDARRGASVPTVRENQPRGRVHPETMQLLQSLDYGLDLHLSCISAGPHGD